MKGIYNCVIIDDEPAPREILAKHIGLHPSLNLLKSFAEAPKALEFLKKNKPDIIFLDIEMPGFNGIHLIENLNTESLVFIFVTAYPQFATKAFELDAADYLNKPVSYGRFTQSIKKAMRNLEYKQDETIILQAGKDHIQIDVDRIDWIRAENYYVNIYGRGFKKGYLMLRLPLYKLEKLLPQDKFFKINRSVIVSLQYIKKIRNNEITLQNGEKFIISRSYKYISTTIGNKLISQ